MTSIWFAQDDFVFPTVATSQISHKIDTTQCACLTTPCLARSSCVVLPRLTRILSCTIRGRDDCWRPLHRYSVSPCCAVLFAAKPA